MSTQDILGHQEVLCPSYTSKHLKMEKTRISYLSCELILLKMGRDVRNPQNMSGDASDMEF